MGMHSSNIADAMLVLLNVVDIYLLPLFNYGTHAKTSILRLTRLFRIARILRMVRVMKLFQSLRILVQTILSSLQSSVWSMILLGIIIVSNGVFLGNMLHEYIMDSTNPEETRLWVYRKYGSSTRAIYTMFEVTLSGCWPNYVETLSSKVSPWYAVYFLVY